MAHIVLGYTPRWYQQQIHDALDKHRFAVLCLHRRSGKTVLAIQELIKRVILCDKPNARGAYICPTYKQAKMVAWTMLKDTLGVVPGVQFNEVELRADLGDKRIQLLGAESYDNLRGIYLDFCVMDEYAVMPPAAWGTVIRPALADRQGRALFISTPRGHNAFYELFREAEADPAWYALRMGYKDTNALDDAEIRALKKEMTEAEFEQEFSCSWQAAIKGAYYGHEMTLAEDEGRVGNVPYDKSLQVITSWDLGVNDATVIWFWQVHGAEIRAIECRAYQGTGLPDIIRDLQELPYIYSQHIGPHDLMVKELGSGLTRLEIASNLGVTFDVAPKQPVIDGINAVRAMLKRVWFDRAKCEQGVEALKQYRTEYDESKGIFKNTPLHDWSSDYCFPMHTRVKVPGGYRAIGELQPGDFVEVGGQPARILNKWDNGIKKTVVLHFDDGSSLECTPNHKVFTTTGLLRADEVRPEDGVLTDLADVSTWLSHSDGLREGFTSIVQAGEYPSIDTRTVKRLLYVEDGVYQNVYDLEIEHHHAYYAEGTLVSNCDSVRYFAITPLRGSMMRRASKPSRRSTARAA